MSVKELNGRELAGYIKERQARVVRGLHRKPRLLIIRDSDDPVIAKYVKLKQRYGEDIGVAVEDFRAHDSAEIHARILAANEDKDVDGVIVQLPIVEKMLTDELCDLIAPSKDVDGLGANADYDSATATAILWLLSGYNIDLAGKRIAIVGRGKLVGAPLVRMLGDSGLDVTMLHRGDDLSKLVEYDVIISATGVPGLIQSDYVAPGTVLVDAGTASENGVIRGDLDPALYKRDDLAAITPVKGGVGPLTVTCLFEHVIEVK